MKAATGEYISEKNVDRQRFISRAFCALGVLSSFFLAREIVSDNKNTLSAVGLVLISFGVAYCRKKEKDRIKAELLEQRKEIISSIEEIEPSNNVLTKTPKN